LELIDRTALYSLISLYSLTCNIDAEKPDRLDGKSGAVFGILKPPAARQLPSFDARPYFAREVPGIWDSLGSRSGGMKHRMLPRDYASSGARF
jgi:hypothetical protein